MQPKLDVSDIKGLSSKVQSSEKKDTGQQSEINIIESRVWQIWERILTVDDFGVDDDLFSVGGDSIAAVQIFSAINSEFGLAIPVSKLFSSEHFSIRWLSALIEEELIAVIGKEELEKLLDQASNMGEEGITELEAK